MKFFLFLFVVLSSSIYAGVAHFPEIKTSFYVPKNYSLDHVQVELRVTCTFAESYDDEDTCGKTQRIKAIVSSRNGRYLNLVFPATQLVFPDGYSKESIYLDYDLIANIDRGLQISHNWDDQNKLSFHIPTDLKNVITTLRKPISFINTKETLITFVHKNGSNAAGTLTRNFGANDRIYVEIHRSREERFAWLWYLGYINRIFNGMFYNFNNAPITLSGTQEMIFGKENIPTMTFMKVTTAVIDDSSEECSRVNCGKLLIEREAFTAGIDDLQGQWPAKFTKNIVTADRWGRIQEF